MPGEKAHMKQNTKNKIIFIIFITTIILACGEGSEGIVGTGFDDKDIAAKTGFQYDGSIRIVTK